MTQETEHPTYQDEPTPDEAVAILGIRACEMCLKITDSLCRWFEWKLCRGCFREQKGKPELPKAKPDQAAAMKQATDLAYKGVASVVGTEPERGIYMVMEGTMRDWRGLLSRVRAQLSGIILDQLSRGAYLRVVEAIANLDTVLAELPQEEATCSTK